MRIELKDLNVVCGHPREHGLRELYYLTWPSEDIIANLYVFVCPNCGTEFYTRTILDEPRVNVGYFQVIDYVRELKKHNLKHVMGTDWVSNGTDKVYCPEDFRKMNTQRLMESYKDISEAKRIWHDAKNKVYDSIGRIRDLDFDCPICKAKIIRENGFAGQLTTAARGIYNIPVLTIPDEVDFGRAMYYGHDSILDLAFGQVRNARLDNEKQQANEQFTELENITKDRYIPKTIGANVNTIDLKEYILKLVKLESNLVSIGKRLETLYFQKIGADQEVRASDSLTTYNVKVDLEKAKKELDEFYTTIKKLKEIVETSSYSNEINPFEEEEPKKPCMPVQPTYSTPGMFNKKKVSEENERLKQKFEQDMISYEAEMSSYNQQKEAWCKQRDIHIQNEYSRLKAEYEEKMTALMKDLSKSKAEVETLTAKYNELSDINGIELPTPERANKNLVEEEIDVAEKMYLKLYECREDMYNFNIIFEKYKNLPAIASFYEYLMSGRCESLEGANGAYNIYEQEIRANIVIGQLSEIIASLEAVKQSQYMIYSELQNMNSTLRRLETTLNSATEAIKNIEVNTTSMNEYLESIANNSEVIAHNTAKTAYYSKINAELTNSLGFMMALNG